MYIKQENKTMAAATLGFIPLQLIPTNAMNQYSFGTSFDKGLPANGTYVVVKTPTVAQQLQLTKSLKEMQSGKEINNNGNIASNNKPVILRCKRRVDFTGLGCKLVDSHNPSVSRRNERERKRVKMVNMGFETLRQHVPSGRKNKKMSKVETLRSAVQYIKQLQEMLTNEESSVGDILSENVDMDELENKVTELIQSATNSMNLQSATVNDNCNNIGTLQLHSQLHQQQQQQQHLESQSQTSEASPVNHQSQEQFYQAYQNSQVFSNPYDQSSAYSQASPDGSLHSPTSSVVSDSSYDSIGDSTTHNDEDILSGFTNWF